MEMFTTSSFWAVLLGTAACCHLLPAERVRTRAALVAAASGLVLVSIVQLSPYLLCYLLGAAVWVTLAVRGTASLARSRPTLATLLVFLPIGVPWVLGKQAVALEWHHLNLLYFLGFSYFAIKTWTLVKDLHDGLVEDPEPLVVFAYLLFFPTYMLGPMHLYGEFDTTLRAPEPLDGESLVHAVFRLVLGLAKLKVLAPLLSPISLDALRDAAVISPAALVVACLAYSVVIWADFSGFSDLAIATSALLGLWTPENFAWPYAAPNIREFWQRWHITFSRVLTGYVFVPLSRRLQGSVGRPGAVMVLSYLGTFLFCGYWHGPTSNYLLWGLYHGVGLIVYDLYRPVAAKRRRQRLRRGEPRSPALSALSHVAAVAVTFLFVSAGWALFVLQPSKLLG